MKRFTAIILLLGVVCAFAACAQEDEPMKIALSINGSVFIATLEANDTAEAFLEMLPQTFEMSELNGNEKYVYLDESLPGTLEQVNSIEAGDLMLYAGDCVVLFYESFQTTYRYARIGRIDDTTGLAEAVGSGAVTVSMVLPEE